MIEWKNFTGMDIADIPIDTEYVHCNFARKSCVDDAGIKKGHRLFPGDDTPRTFTKCNMVNCEPPPGNTCTECNGAIFESAVIINTDTITIDSEIITLNEYGNIVYGRYKGGIYEYKSTPTVIPIKIKHSGEK